MPTGAALVLFGTLSGGAVPHVGARLLLSGCEIRPFPPLILQPPVDERTHDGVRLFLRWDRSCGAKHGVLDAAFAIPPDPHDDPRVKPTGSLPSRVGSGVNTTSIRGVLDMTGSFFEWCVVVVYAREEGKGDLSVWATKYPSR